MLAKGVRIVQKLTSTHSAFDHCIDSMGTKYYDQEAQNNDAQSETRQNSDEPTNESTELVSKPITRPPSYGTLSAGPPDPFTLAEGQAESQSGQSETTIIPNRTLACLLLQHVSR